MGRTIYMELVGSSRIAIDLSAGGLMVQDKTLALHEVCEIVVFNDGGQLELPAKAVYVDGNGGVGLELVGFGAALKAKIAELIEAGAAAAAAGSDVGVEPGHDGDPSTGFGLGSVSGRDLEIDSAGSDIAIGVGSDVGIETGIGAGSDVGIETGTGAGSDVGIETGLGVGSDVGIEVSADAGVRGSNPSIDGGELELAGGTAAPAEAKATDAQTGEDFEIEDDADDERKTLHQRLRGLPLIAQVKLAKAGDITERMLLERMYGKNVWEPLLRNPRLTAPEVARIARMGALPRPMIELIVGNGAWLQVPEVRRALLSNPRLGTDQIIKLLRMMSKQELKLATMQTAYSMAVRQQAKALLKADGG